MSKKDYALFLLADFLDDDFFIQSVLRDDPENHSFWNSFLLRHPEMKSIVTQASAIIRAARKQERFTNEFRKDVLWARINETLEHQPAVRNLKRSIPMYMKIAAAAAFVLVCTGVFWLSTHDDMNTVTTAFNEVTTITLPDRSIVALNGNSTLRYQKNSGDEFPREVWLSGEAYFNVSHLNENPATIKAGDRFIVHTENVNIEVLGTSFNVKNRKDQTNITLITGKVKVLLEKSVNKENLIMLPGDYLEFNNKRLISKKKLQNPQQISAWSKPEYIFTNATLGDIMKTLSDDYGYVIDIKDTPLLKLKIEGEISVASMEELLSTISATLDLHVEEKNRHIIISSK
jgi:ferric-dicitrate binding protein FerR (iron transport regulator)